MKKWILAILLMGLAVMAFQPAWALEAQKLRIATLSMGSSWYVYGGVMADILRKALPSGSVIDVLPYAGGIGNMDLAFKGEAEIALGFPMAAKWAYEGIVAYDKKMTNLRALAGGFDQYYVGIVATKKSKITALEEIAQKKIPVRVATVTKGSTGELANRQILEAVGAPYKTIESFGGKVTHTAFGVITKMLVDGQADIFMQVVTEGHPAMTEIAITADVVFIGLSEPVIKKLTALGWTAATIPAKTFKGQDQPVPTIGTTTCLVVKDSMSNDLAYAITKALCENRETLAKGHAGLKPFDPQSAWKPENLGLPLHPGAEKYFKEKGWMK